MPNRVFAFPKWPTWNRWPKPGDVAGKLYTTGANYYVGPAGNDGNNGTAVGTPWQTDTKLRTMIGNNTIKAGVFFYTATKLAVPYTTLSELGQKGVADAVIAGTISHSGDVINFLGIIPLTGPFAGAGAIGARVVNWGTAGGLDNSRTLAASGWTNPSGAIWKLPAPAGVTAAAGVVWEGATQLTPQSGANFAAVTAALGAAGTFWVDPTTSDVYVHATAGGSPNSNGLTYRQAQSWFATDAPLVEISGGYMTATAANYGIVKYTATYNSSNGVLISLNVGSSDGSKMTVVQRTIHDRFGKHGFELACGAHNADATQAQGMIVFDDCPTTNAPTGFGPGSYSDFVAFIDLIGAGPGKFYVRFNNCQDAANSVTGWTSHNNGDTLQIRRMEWTSCTANGGGGFGASECGHAVITSCTLNSGVSFNAIGSTTVTASTFNYRLPDLGNSGSPGPITLTGNTFTPGNTYAGACAIGSSGGTVTVISTGNIFALSAGTGNSAQWIRGGVLNLSFGDTITANTNVPLIGTFTTASDLLAFVGSTIYGVVNGGVTKPNALLINSVNGGGSLTYTTAVANGTTGVSATGGTTLNGASVGTGAPANLYTGIVHGIKSGVQDSITTDAVDLTGKNFASISLTSRQGVTMTVNDNNANVFAQRTPKSGAGNLGNTITECIYDCLAFVGKVGHTFTAAGANSWATIKYIAAVKASGSPLFDQESGTNGAAAQLSPGSKTPAVAGSLVFTGAAVDFSTSATLTVDVGYTQTDLYTVGNGFGGAAADLPAGNIAITAPTWTGSVQVAATVMAIYK